MSSCDRSSSYGIQNYPICSANGVCDEGLCKCYEGWTGYTDLQLGYGYDCDVSLFAVKIWAEINLTLGILSFLLILYCIIREQVYIRSKITKVKSICIFIFFALVIFTILFSIEKMINPEKNIIGSSYRLEMWGLGITSMTCYGISAYFIIMIKFLRNYSRLIDPKTRALINNNVDTLTFIAPWFATGFMLSYAILLISLHFVPPSYSDSFSVAECVLYTIAYCYYGLTVIYSLHIFLLEMGKIVNNTSAIDNRVSEIQNKQLRTGAMTAMTSAEDIKSVYYKIRLAYKFIIPFYANGIPLNVFFAAWNFLRRKIVFFFLLQITLVIMMSAFLVWSLTTAKKAGFVERIGLHMGNSISIGISMMSYRKSSMSTGSKGSRANSVHIRPHIVKIVCKPMVEAETPFMSPSESQMHGLLP